MGSSLCGSSPIYSYTDVQLKEMQSARPIFDLLGLKWNSKQALAIYEVFDHAVDNTESQANVNKLCKTLRLPREHFYTHSFTVFGNQSKSIVVASNRWQMAAKATVERCSFSQYLAGLWNLCTLSLPYGLAIWMYRMHFGNEGAHPKNVLELLDKRYGISEERDYHAQIDKRWYGNDYHKNNLKRTKNLIQRYTNQQTNLIPPAGWIELIKKSPGLLQNHISARKALRESVCGEKFWKKMDDMKTKTEDLKNIDTLTRSIEQDFPGVLCTPEGREFFNVDHYNFNAPADVKEIEHGSHNIQEVSETDVVNGHPEVEGEVHSNRLLPSGIKAGVMDGDVVMTRKSPTDKPQPASNAPSKKPRADAAARAARAKRYKELRGNRDENLEKNEEYKEIVRGKGIK